jgi:hypothetical protein
LSFGVKVAACTAWIGKKVPKIAAEITRDKALDIMILFFYKYPTYFFDFALE